MFGLLFLCVIPQDSVGNRHPCFKHRLWQSVGMK